MRKLKLFVITLILLIGVLSEVEGQNIAITDDNAYTAHSSAMLDVKSLTKGMLVPRLTTVQRNAIPLPATGLLVFDTNENVFYYYTGSVWSNLSVGQLWTKNGNYVYLSNTDDNVGIGVTTPENKLLVKADASTGIDESIFAVLNNAGDTVFAVYQEGVRIWVNDAGGSKANGSRGGFAVGGFNPAKAGLTNEYLRVTPDSVRIYIDDDFVGSKATGNRGGFAVGGFNPAKGTPTDNYLFVQDDSTRVYVTGDEGFAIDNIEAGSEGRYMDLTPNNYFIGHESGDSITTGLYNSYFGYQTGKSTKTADDNVFIGYQSGFLNNSGSQNVFLGKETGYNNTLGYSNCFMGHQAGLSNIDGYSNCFIGHQAGYNNIDGFYNILLGYRAGFSSTSSIHNTFVGYQSGMNNTTGWGNVFLASYSGYDNITGFENIFIGGSSGVNNIDGFQNICIGVRAGFSNNNGDRNVFIGEKSGYYETGSDRLYIENTDTQNPLIFGEFDNDRVGINDGWPSANLHVKQVGTDEEGFAIENDGDFDVWSWEIGLNDLQLFFNGNYVGYWDDADGSYTSVSDKRLKKDIEQISEPVLPKVLKLKTVRYRLNHAEENTRKAFGFIAQDVELHFPELVKYREDGFLSLNYDDFGIISIKAIQEQQKIIEDQNSKIEKLEKENTEFKQQMQSLLQRIEILEK